MGWTSEVLRTSASERTVGVRISCAIAGASESEGVAGGSGLSSSLLQSGGGQERLGVLYSSN